jgi:hypothetical protein
MCRLRRRPDGALAGVVLLTGTGNAEPRGASAISCGAQVAGLPHTVISLGFLPLSKSLQPREPVIR